VLCVAAAAGLLWWRRRAGLDVRSIFAPRVVLPFFLVCLAGFSWLAYYNYRVTGSPWVMPYMVNDRMYAASPMFYFLPAPAEPHYRHEMLRKFWIGWEKLFYVGTRHNPLRVVLAFWEVVPFIASTLVFFSAMAGLLAFGKSRKMRVVIGALAALTAALLLEKSWHPHYFSPGAGLLLIPAMYGLRWLRVSARHESEAAILLFVTCCFLGQTLSDSITEYRTRTPTIRQEAERKIKAAAHGGDRELVIVRYSPDHDPLYEFVFNRADIDHSSIVWARDMGDEKNRELIAYYPNRRVWLLEPDSPSLTVIPYPRKDSKN
jgi:hypothetical protein